MFCGPIYTRRVNTAGATASASDLKTGIRGMFELDREVRNHVSSSTSRCQAPVCWVYISKEEMVPAYSVVSGRGREVGYVRIFCHHFALSVQKNRFFLEPSVSGPGINGTWVFKILLFFSSLQQQASCHSCLIDEENEVHRG